MLWVVRWARGVFIWSGSSSNLHCVCEQLLIMVLTTLGIWWAGITLTISCWIFYVLRSSPIFILLTCNIPVDWLQSLNNFSSMCPIIYLQPVLLWWLCFKVLKTESSEPWRLATSIQYDTLMKKCFKGWSQSNIPVECMYFQSEWITVWTQIRLATMQ